MCNVFPSFGADVDMATDPREGGLLEVEKQKVSPPPLYRVLLLNDDYTPMDFVVGVLQSFFGMTREQATQVMLKVHRTEWACAASIQRTSPQPRSNL
jgi:ATP-dependent Clp protease adapter protein ClpS